MTYHFIIPGKPTGQPRPGTFGKQRFSTAFAKSRTSLIQQIALAAGVRPMEGPVDLTVRVIQPLPKSWPKKRQSAAAGRPDVRKPDLDNTAKQIADALNGIAYADDCQIARLLVEKVVALPGEDPKTLVWIREIT